MRFTTTLRCAAALIMIGTLPTKAAAQCVDWTAGYNIAGIGGSVAASALFDDGSGNGVELYVGGSFETADDVVARNVAKWNGTRWAAVGAGRPGTVNALLVWDDGSGPKLYAGSEGVDFTAFGGSLTTVAAWDGTAWTGLPGGIVVNGVKAMAVHDDGSGPALYASAIFYNINGPLPVEHVIARFDGTSWSTVGSGLYRNPNTAPITMAVHDDGSGPELFVGGDRLSATPGGPLGLIWRWDGSTWSDASAGWYPQGFVQSMAVVHSSTGAETLYAGGLYTLSNSTQKLMRWNGSGWTGVGTNLFNTVVALFEVPQPGAEGLLLAGGFPTFMGFAVQSGVGIWSNSQWSLPSAPLNLTARTLALYDEGAGHKVFAGTTFATFPGYTRGVARLDGAAWVTPGTAGAGEFFAIDRLQAVRDVAGPKLYACGVLSAGSTHAPRVAQLAGHTWSTVGPAFGGGNVNSLCAFDDGVHGEELYAGGTFTNNGGYGMNRVARWDGTSWQPLGPGLAHVVLGGNVFDLTPYDDGSGQRLVAVGDFNISAGAPMPYIAVWDGAQWSDLGGGFDAQARSAVVFDDGSGPALYVGGYFQFAGGVPTRHVARWNGSAWSAVGAGTVSVVHGLLVHDDGNGPKLYAHSDFGNPRLLRWDGATWQGLPGGPNTCDALASYDDGTGAGPRLYVAGNFGTHYGGTFDGSSWSPMGTGVTGTIDAFAVFDDGQGPALFAGGLFARAGSYGSHNIARYGPTGACTPITGTIFCAGDGTGTACPCGNVGATRHGCASSTNSAGAALVAEGQAHLSSDTVTLRASGMGASASLLFFQGTGQAGGGLGVAFGDGLRCVNGTVVRLAVRQASAGSKAFGHAVAGDPHVASAGHLGTTWTTRNYQVWYRDAQTFCTSALYNLTNGVEIRWAP